MAEKNIKKGDERKGAEGMRGRLQGEVGAVFSILLSFCETRDEKDEKSSNNCLLEALSLCIDRGARHGTF